MLTTNFFLNTVVVFTRLYSIVQRPILEGLFVT